MGVEQSGQSIMSSTRSLVSLPVGARHGRVVVSVDECVRPPGFGAVILLVNLLQVEFLNDVAGFSKIVTALIERLVHVGEQVDGMLH